MSLSCDCDFDGGADVAYWWSSSFDFITLQTKRSRKCKSCGCFIKPGAEVVEFTRWRNPKDDVETRIWGEDGEISLASWFMCETCGGLAMAVQDTGMCFSIDENVKDQIAEYRAETLTYRSKL